jgi:hypothetical protein
MIPDRPLHLAGNVTIMVMGRDNSFRPSRAEGQAVRQPGCKCKKFGEVS